MKIQSEVPSEIYQRVSADLQDSIRYWKKYEELSKALIEGKVIQYVTDTGVWCDCHTLTFKNSLDKYRVKPEEYYTPSSYEKLKEALREGNSVQWEIFNDYWIDIYKDNFVSSLEKYRIGPKKKYVPFSYEDRDKLLGSFIQMKNQEDNPASYIITEVGSTYIGTRFKAIKYGELLNAWTFLDGSPCGKLKED